MLKQDVAEAGSSWLRPQVASATAVTSWHLLIVETLRAFREGGLLLDEYRHVRHLFREECCATYQIVPLTLSIVDLPFVPCSVREQHPLRGYHAIHLATALIVHRSLLELKDRIVALHSRSESSSRNQIANVKPILTELLC